MSEESKPGAGALRVVVAEDTALLREGIVLLLRNAGHDVVGQTDNGDDLLLKVRSYAPDVVVVDVRMPPTHTDEGLVAAREIRERHPGTGVLVLSSHLEPAYAAELVADDASGVGYLLKDRVYDVDEFLSAVERVAAGGTAFDAKVVSALVGRSRNQGGLDELTDRERDVLALMAEGRTNQAIAGIVHLSPRAVERTVTSIFGKLRLPDSPDSHRRVLAVIAYLQG
jgi:DNA-binding NarL/FixJ family response regulator